MTMTLSLRAQAESTDSPAPILISENSSTRVLTNLSAVNRQRGRTAPPSVFSRGAQVTVFVTNVELQPGEGANAFRVYAEGASKHTYKYPVVALTRVPGMDWIYALTVRLEDEIGYWNPPLPNGDLLLSVSWRGMQSNRVRIGYGATGGKIKDDDGAGPTPLSMTRPSTQKTRNAVIGDGRWGRDVTRLLEQSTFGPTVALEKRVAALGMRPWLDEQFKMQYSDYESTYPNLPLMPYDSNVGCPSTAPTTCMRDNYQHYQFPLWFFKQSFYGEQQLRHRVSWALSQVWVVSAYSGQHPAWMMHYHRVLARNAFGNWRQLMKEMTLNPAMGNYLDMMRSTKWDPNENYAREIMQLFNVGLFMLNQDGSFKRDGQQQKIPTYSQQTVENLARVFTGWSLCETSGCPSRVVGAPNFKDSMVMSNWNNHDTSAKTLLDYPGVTTNYIYACTGCNSTAVVNYANSSLEQALDNIYNHPNVAPFVSRLLIQHLVTSDPSPAYIERVANVFDQNRTNPTQMKEVIKAVLLDPEARGSVKTDPRFGKLREPVQFFTNMMRHLNVSSWDLAGESDGNVTWNVDDLGQGPFTPPTVFNYYQPDFVIPGTNMLGPEFGLYTTGSAVKRANLVQQFVEWGIGADGDWNPKGTRVNLSDLEALMAADSTGNRLLDDLNKRMLHGTMTESMRTKILSAMNDLPSNQTANKVKTAVYLVASSLQFQVQR